MRATVVRLAMVAALVAPVLLVRPPVAAAVAPRITMRVWVTGYDDVGYTFSGIWTHPGSCAVDPRYIPLGSYITVYGLWTCHAEDTGSAVIGYHVDMWVPTAAQAYAITGWYTASWGVTPPQVLAFHAARPHAPAHRVPIHPRATHRYLVQKHPRRHVAPKRHAPSHPAHKRPARPHRSQRRIVRARPAHGAHTPRAKRRPPAKHPAPVKRLARPKPVRARAKPVLRPASTPRPTATLHPTSIPTPTLTATLVASTTPRPTYTAVATATPQPTSTSQPTYTAAATATARPSTTATATARPSTTATATARPSTTATVTTITVPLSRPRATTVKPSASPAASRTAQSSPASRASATPGVLHAGKKWSKPRPPPTADPVATATPETTASPIVTTTSAPSRWP